MSERQQHLLQAIEQAFRGVELGDGVSLHETIVIDDYGGTEARQAARIPDEKHDWRKLVGDPELAKIIWVGGLSFYDAAGLRFHLPAYLSLAVTDPEGDNTGDMMESLMFHMTDLSEYSLERFAILDGPQRICVRDVLVFIREVYQTQERDVLKAEEPSPRLERLDQALQGYWSSGS